ncbi:MAG: hypothetical protein FWF94_00790 [Oscillospiraceae bacterium]|nr:hypothetical protein [Oscillospiraceae bacterium]
MIINGNLINNQPNAHHSNLPKNAAEKTQEKANTLATDNVDKFDADSVNVNRNFQNAPGRTDEAAIRGYKGQSVIQMKNAVVADYVSQNFKKQSGVNFWKNIADNTSYTPSAFALSAYNKAEATSKDYDDYWGVEATAQRLFTFAKSIAGNDEKMFETMKNAFLKGFNQALGTAGKLPDISYQTKARTLELFDAWGAEIKSSKNPAPAPAEPAATEKK